MGRISKKMLFKHNRINKEYYKCTLWEFIKNGNRNMFDTNLTLLMGAGGGGGAVNRENHGLINYKDTRVICRHLKNLPVKGLCA